MGVWNYASIAINTIVDSVCGTLFDGVIFRPRCEISAYMVKGVASGLWSYLLGVCGRLFDLSLAPKSTD